MSTLDSPVETIRVLPDDRYARQRLISWWEQDRLAAARVLVIGAGALGNEILKLLALSGVGHIMIYDMDRIEVSNLSRTVLFKESDAGAFKAAVAAQRVLELNPQAVAIGRSDNIIHATGLGVFFWADVVICGLDNRLARMFVNSSCARTRRTWIDGAIEGLSGIVRVFDPARTACYECTMNEADRKHVQDRLSCAMLARDEISLGHVPTTSVAASLIAALEVQEAIKYLHGQPTLDGEGIHVNGMWHDFSRVQYRRRDDCTAHDTFEQIVPLPEGVNDITLGELLDRAEAKLGHGVTLELSRDVVTALTCPVCEKAERVGLVLGALREAAARCPVCGTHRVVQFSGIVVRDGELDLSLTPGQIGVPPFDVIVVRQGIDKQEAWLFAGDAAAALGDLASSFVPDQISVPKET
jgi:adenylyltransferase/sulfurtransferase